MTIIVTLISLVICISVEVDSRAAMSNCDSNNILGRTTRRNRLLLELVGEIVEDLRRISNRAQRVPGESTEHFRSTVQAGNIEQPTFGLTSNVAAESPHTPEILALGRPKVAITSIMNSIQEQLVNYILAHMATTKEDTYVYYISVSNSLPFSVSDHSRMFILDECYLVILKETCDSGEQWNVYYLVGMNSDKNARSTAAKYALRLHDKLKIFNNSFIYRKFETFTYRKFIENAKTYLPRKDVITMYLITEKDAENKNKNVGNKNKNTDDIIIKRVLPNPNYYKADTCVVISSLHTSGKSKITRACGPEVKSAVQARAEKLTNLVNRRSIGNIQTTTDSSTIMIELGIDATLEEDIDRDGPPQLFVFPKYGEKGNIVTIPEKVEFLDNSACYILDSKNYSGVFFWIGSHASIIEQTTGVEKMENYINIDLKLPHTQVTIMEQGKETTDFLLNFPKWYT